MTEEFRLFLLNNLNMEHKEETQLLNSGRNQERKKVIDKSHETVEAMNKPTILR